MKWLIGLFLWLPLMVQGQNPAAMKIDLDLDNAPLETALAEIEKQTGVTFAYGDNIDRYAAVRVTLAADDISLEEAIARVLSGTNLRHVQEGNHVVIEKKPLVQPQVQQGLNVTGTVADSLGVSIPGVTVLVRGSQQGTITDADGSYSLAVPSDTTVLQYRFIGYRPQEERVGDRRTIDVTLQAESNELGEVVAVAFGLQRKESVVSAIQTVRPQELRVPSSNLTTAFAGRIAGMISYQTSGEPGQDQADFFIRGITTFGTGKVDPLILVDNMETSASELSKMHPDDIASFSVLKDATATALYGARGANGVILVTTKEGREGRIQVSVRLENSWSQPTSLLEMADPITYMRLANEAVYTRDPLLGGKYSNSKIDNTIRGGNPYVYPAVDWLDMLTKRTTANQRANLNVSGGGQVARYYIAGSFSQDNGILNVDRRNNFNNNVDYKKYLLRSNINIDLTPTTEAVVRMSGSFDGYNGPIMGGNDLFRSALNVSPVRFPAYYEPDKAFSGVDHILFGNDEGSSWFNPYAEMLRGYRETSTSTMMAQMEIKQDLGPWIEGLSLRFLGNTTRYANFSLRRSYSPYYYSVGTYDRMNDTYTLMELNPDGGTEYLDFEPVSRTVDNTAYGEASVNYSRTFAGKHAVSGMLVGIARHYQSANAGTLSTSLPERNLGVSGRFTYAYDSRYFGEFNFGYNGSEKFDKGHRWGFFPSVGMGWSVSNEAFWKGRLKDVVSRLRLRATYGLVGNDNIGSARFFYLSDVIIGGGEGFTTGYEYNGQDYSGIRVNTYANPKIGWEIAYKTNVGIDLGLFRNKVEVMVDLFREHRTNILQTRADVPVEMGLWETPQVNVGEALGKGIDLSVDYNHSLSPDAWIVGRANFTYATSAYEYFEEVDYAALGSPYKSKKGHSVRQQWGLVAERLFIDGNEVAASPRQDFGEYMAGDIKYKDLNGDRVINELDEAPIGHPTVPEINYGFGFSAGYKNWDLSLFFSGSARSSFWIDAAGMSPFVQKPVSSSDGRILETGLARFIADDHWDELSQNPQAAWPRLSDRVIDNNTRRNTWFLRNGSFLRLKSAEIGYTLPEAWTRNIGLDDLRVYASGTNLLMLSGFKLWDVEMGSNGLGYPLQRVVNLGVSVSF